MGLCVAIVSGSQVKVGSELKQFNSYKYETPHGRQMRVPKKTQLIVVAFEKDTGKLVNEYLKTKNSFYMPKHHAIFIADISKMPTIITNTFALPKLRKYKHPIYLHFDDDFSENIPQKEEKVTLLEVEDGKITNISYATTKEQLQAAIER